MATLFDYYKKQGKPLPSVRDRSSLFEQAGLGKSADYAGTAEQNVKLLGNLEKGGTAGDPARTGAGNQDPSRAGAARIPTAEESRASGAQAALEKFQSPYTTLVDRIAEARSKIPSASSLLSEERSRQKLPEIETEIAKTQSVLDDIDARLGRNLFTEEQRQIPLGLVRGRQALVKEQSLLERGVEEQRLGRLEGRRGRGEQLATEVAKMRQQEAEAPAASLERELELRKGIPGQGEQLKSALAPFEKPKEAEIRTVGNELVRIGADGKAEVIFKSAKAAGTGASTEEKEIAAFRKDAANLIGKLDAGELAWGTAFDTLKTLYPKAANETIDAILGGSANYEGESGTFGEPAGRARVTPGVVEEKKKKK